MQEGNFKEYIYAFEKKLEQVSVEEISNELYCRKYLSYLLGQKKYFLDIYADVLNKLATHSSTPKAETILLDYGAGNGLLGLFAKFCGFKKVFINDMDPAFVKASERLAHKLGILVDGFIAGDIADVQTYFNQETPDVVIGTDVIEHIYDLDIFFTAIRKMNPSMLTVFTTASNPGNYFKVKALRKLQLKDELEGGKPDDHILFGETALKPFLEIRQQIIRKYKPDLPELKIAELAKASRGLKEEDIIKAVDRFMQTGSLPVPAKGANTCNPLNGSWTERILPLSVYEKIYSTAGFKPVFYNGFYNVYGHGLKNFAKKMLNAVTPTFGKWISPYIAIIGFKQD